MHHLILFDVRGKHEKKRITKYSNKRKPDGFTYNKPSEYKKETNKMKKTVY